jgi:hypothetical protein
MFKIPDGYCAWCMLCNKGFEWIEDLAKHNRENVEQHHRRSGRKDRLAVKKNDAIKPVTADK